MRKYRNHKVAIDGIQYDSKKEASRHAELLLLERGGVISNLELQPVYRIEINGILVCKYIGDFRYVENGQAVVEDVKSPITRKHPVYRLKYKLVQAVHGISIKEV
jgi:hypothetical protein